MATFTQSNHFALLLAGGSNDLRWMEWISAAFVPRFIEHTSSLDSASHGVFLVHLGDTEKDLDDVIAVVLLLRHD